MRICFSVDSKLLNKLKVPVHSIMAHTSTPVKFYVMTRGITNFQFKHAIRRFPKAEYNQIPMDRVKYGTVKLAKWVSVSTMDRLLMPSLFDFDKVIYLDIDLVVKADLIDLYNHETGECGIAAKQSSRAGYLTNIDYATRTNLDVEALKQLTGEHYNFNAGVLVMSLDKMRANNSQEITIDLVNKTACNDQIALCSYSKDRFKRLAPHWNTWVGVDHDQIEKPSIIHYVGSRKPWQTVTPLRSEWIKYL